MTALDYLLLILAAIMASEVLLRLPLLQQIGQVMMATRKAAATIRSRRISDHWKEAVIPAYSLRIAGRSILFFVLLCVALLPVVAIGLVAPGGIGRWFGLLMTPTAILVLCVCSIAYIVVRTRLIRG